MSWLRESQRPRPLPEWHWVSQCILPIVFPHTRMYFPLWLAEFLCVAAGCFVAVTRWPVAIVVLAYMRKIYNVSSH